MFKRIALACGIALLLAPVFAMADTSPANNPQLVALYTQLVQLLGQELALLQNPSQASLSIWPSSGTVPLAATFMLDSPSGTEVIDFGDGHATGSNGCAKNALGWCDLSQPFGHTYQFPGAYLVTLYRHTSPTEVVALSTSTVTVTGPALPIPF
jgi:hypothetical protein